MDRIEPHSHTWYSNLRLLDSINNPEKLIDRAIENGLKGIAITDHESLSSFVKVYKYSQEVIKEHPDFKVMLGNEIYLCKTRDMGQPYFHFILIAKNENGYKALKELSSRAWMNSFYDRGYERVVTLYSDVEEILTKYPNSLIATTACIGGELGHNTLKLITAERLGDSAGAAEAHDNIVNFILWAKRMFGTDFYIECAPGLSKDQIAVNKRLPAIAQCFDVKMVIGTDAHFLKKEDRFVHKSYLNSKSGEREVDIFYEYAYLQTNEEIFENLKGSSYDEDFISSMFNNSMEIYNKVEHFNILHSQQIPKVQVKYYPEANMYLDDTFKNYPHLCDLFASKDIVRRYWVNECLNSIHKKFNMLPKAYLDELEEEARVKEVISDKLQTNMFMYPVTLQHYIDLIWECGSTIGAGRGSACAALNHYCLGVTQLDPIEYDLPFFRYLNDERVELGDIDIDIAPSKRPAIIQAIKKERGANFNANIDNISRKNLGCTYVATFGTETSKSAILTACRGYRSEDYPDGIDNDTAQYLSSLIPIERGFVWSISDAYYGNPAKDRKPVTAFVNKINTYPRLLEIILSIEGTVKSRGIHASGIIFFDEDPYQFGCFMKAPSGEITTQFDLHDAEAAGMTKFDFLATDVQDKLTQFINILQEKRIIESNLSLREAYNKYFHPNVLPIDNNTKIWDAIENGKVLDLFQFDGEVGKQAAKKVKARNIVELCDANGLMRLMTAEKGQETPMDKYVRFKNDISLWYKEMDDFGLTKEEQKTLEPYFKSSYGVPPSQEQLMKMLMDKDICNFTLAEANTARKIVGKKQMSKIPELKEKVLTQAKRNVLGEYVWKYGVGPQMGYSFSIIHSLAYSFIGVQSAYAATNWNPIYWNTACLIVNSGSLEDEEDEEEIVDLYEEEDEDAEYEDLPDRSGKKKKEKSTDYAKLATAIGKIRNAGIKVSLADINNSALGFYADDKNNEILFGLKGMNRVGKKVVEKIISGRPYLSIVDFMNRCPLGAPVMLSLIKGGAFDKIDNSWASKIYPEEPRKAIMAYYLTQKAEMKSKLTLQNFNGLIQKNIVPSSLQRSVYIFNFNKALKKQKKGLYYPLEGEFLSFYSKNFDIEKLNVINGVPCIHTTVWDKMYQAEMDTVREWLSANQKEVLDEYNTLLFKEKWDKNAAGNISYWEMESLCFYYHEHELSSVDTMKYGIADFNQLPEEPEVDYFIKRKDAEIPIYKLTKIIGTVISKDDSHSSICLLTTTGVVTVKFTKEYYAMYKQQISTKNAEGKKTVVEKGWFKRGEKLMITGFRRESQFVAKAYKNTPTHQLYKITAIDNGNIELVHDRVKV